ncbi:hypothetical protein MLD38_028332 [Melastoma candidum]|uniref:Uncharacterized protein n=1 Tax=Melastoma candidum TaxID=119954 RepID=A0ACB9N220_9MYRT|nr:hypothetical protein MLD38_028332 [Melastoma candidum]
MDSSASADFSPDLEILRVGNVLLKDPPSSAEEMLQLLDIAEDALSTMEQTLPDSRKHELLPVMKALITDNLLKSKNEEISASAASCLAELMRIAAPEAPYEDDIMEDIFLLMAGTFTKLSQPSGRCYEKAATTLYTVARVKACLLMLDLELYGILVDVFNNFLSVIEINNTDGISWSIEAIITDVLEEGNGMHPTVLRPLLSCLKKGKKRMAPIAAAMIERILRNCAGTMQPLLKEAVQLDGSSMDSFSSVVASICCGKLTCPGPAHSNGASGTEGDAVFVRCPDYSKSIQADAEEVSVKDSACIDDKRMDHTGASTGSTKFEMELCALPKKRSRKPNALILPEEGYDPAGTGLTEDTPKPKHRRRTMAGAASATLMEKSVGEHSPQIASKSLGMSAPELKMSLECHTQGGGLKKAGDINDPTPLHAFQGKGNLKIRLLKSPRKRRKQQLMDLPMANASTPGPDRDTIVPNNVQPPGNELVGQRIKVWWPKDMTFYQGVVHSFDPIKKKHRVLYTDGEEELLNLRRQRWELIRDRRSRDKLKANVPKVDSPLLPGTSGAPKTNAAASDDSSEDTVSDDNIYEVRMRPRDKHRLLDAVSGSESSETTLDDGAVQPRPRSRVSDVRV